MKKISFIIPVYRNEGSIAILYDLIEKLFIKELKQYNYECIFINDGSDDTSLDVLLKIKAKSKKLIIINLSRNFGQVSASLAGFRESTGDVLISLSADLQEPIEMIPKMVSEWENGNDLVICYRSKRNDGIFRNLSSHFFYRLIKISNPLMPVGGFDFFLLSNQVLKEFNKLNQTNRFFQGDLLWLGFNIKFIPYERLNRIHGKSQYNLSKRIKYFIDGILNTAYWPIRMMSFFGFIFAFLGFIYALIVIYARLINETPFKGYAPIVILILIIGGLLMIMLGVIGEYVWRIYDETKQRPHYIVKNKYK